MKSSFYLFGESSYRQAAFNSAFKLAFAREGVSLAQRSIGPQQPTFRGSKALRLARETRCAFSTLHLQLTVLQTLLLLLPGAGKGLRLQSSQSSRHLFHALRLVPVPLYFRAARDCWPVGAGGASTRDSDPQHRSLRLRPASHLRHPPSSERRRAEKKRSVTRMVGRGRPRVGRGP